MRVLVEASRSSSPTLVEQRARARLALGVVGADAVDRHRLDQRLADREARVQAAYGFWNTIWMRRRIGSSSRLATAPAGRVPSNIDLPPPAAARLVQAQQRQPDRRLARARLADHAQRVAACAAWKSRRCTALNSLAAEHARFGARSSWRSARTSMQHRRARVLRPRRPCRRRCARRCDRRSPAGAARRWLERSAGRRAAPWCRRPAARRRSRRPAPCSRTMPWRITTTWSAISPTSAEVVADEQHAHPVPLLQPRRAARGSGAGS